MPRSPAEATTDGRASRVSRRQFLGATAVGTTGLIAGCAGGDGGGDGGDGGGDDGDAGDTPSPTPTTADDGGEMQTDLTFISGPPESLAFGMGNALSSIVRDNSELTLNVKSGTSGNAVSSVARGEVDMGWGTTLIGTQAKNESGPFDGVDFPQTILQLPSFYFLGLAAFVRTNSDIEYYSDLAGKSLAPGPSGASYWGVWELALAKTLDLSGLKVVNSGVGQLADILTSGRAVSVGGPTFVNRLTPGFMQQVMSQADVRMLGWKEETMQAIQDDPLTPAEMVRNDNFESVVEFTMPEETFFVMASYVMWTSDAIGEDTIYTLFKTAWENRQALGEAHAAYRPWADASWYPRLMTSEVPVHPGAVKFLKEIGSWDDELTEGSV